MGEVIVQPWILRLTLWVMLATFVVLIVTILMARATRAGRERTLARRVGPLRSDVLALVSGEDDAGVAESRLRALRGAAADQVAPVLIGYLSKIRGAPAQRVVDVLVAHGLVRRARTGVTSLSGTRRARSVWTLGVMRIRDSVADVAPRLQDRDRGVAVTAARSLGMLGEGGSAEALLAAVAPGRRGRGDLPVWVVVEALSALGPETAEIVGEALESSDASTRAVAAMTIGHAQHLSQKPRLRALAAESETEDPFVITSVAGALGALGDPADVALLAGLTAHSHPRSLRLAAVRGLGDLGDPRAIAELGELLADTDPRIGELAADVLIDLGPEGRVEVERHATGDGAEAAASAHALVMYSLRHPSREIA